MKSTMKKALSILLSVLLLTSGSLGVFASAATFSLKKGNDNLAIPELSTAPLPNGIIEANEYGAATPTRLSIGNGLWADETITSALPEFVDLYLAQNDGSLYVAVGIKQASLHPTKNYSFETFLGFGSDSEQGATTRFEMFEVDYSKKYVDDKKWAIKKCMETRVTKTLANGGERLYSVENGYLYPLTCWGSVDTANKGEYTYVFEVELSFEDSVLASGLEWDGKVPANANFAFDLGVYDANGNETGKVHFNRVNPNGDVGGGDVGGGESGGESGGDVGGGDVGGGESGGEVGGGESGGEVGGGESGGEVGGGESGGEVGGGESGGEVGGGESGDESGGESGGEVGGEVTPSVPNLPSLDLSGSDATVKDLIISNALDMSPAFNPAVTQYTVIIPDGEIPDISLVTNDPEATYTVLGLDSIKTDEDFDLTVIPTAQNGAKGAAYTLHFTHSLKFNTYVATGNSLPKVMEEIRAVENWGPGDAVEIQLFGTYTETSEILLGIPTLFRANGTKLPIILNGFGGSTFELTSENTYSTNDITFRNLNIKGEGNLYAGSGNLVMDGAVFEENTLVSVFADPHTEAAFIGWTEENFKLAANKNGVLENTVVMGAGTVHHVDPDSKVTLGSIGSDELLKAEIAVTVDVSKLNPVMIIDGADVSRAGARVGFLPVLDATVELRSGKVGILTGDSGFETINSATNFQSDTIIVVTGGEVTEYIRPLKTNTTKAGTVIDISGNPTIQSIKASEETNVYMNSVLNISGGTFNGDVEGSPATLSTRNNISGGTFNGTFFGLGNGGSRRVINTVTGGSFNAYYGGHAKAGNIRGVTNAISGATFAGNFVGGNRSGTLYGSIINEIENCTFSGHYIGGNETGIVETTITNTIKSGTFSSTKGLDFSGGSYDGTVKGNITNNVTGGKFYGFHGASAKVPTKADPGQGVVKGTVINNIKGGSFGNRSGYGLAFIAGTRQGVIEKGIINNISGGTFGSRFLGGSFVDGTHSQYDIGLNKNGQSITTTINGGTFNGGSDYYHFGGSLGAFHKGPISTTINNATFSRPFYFGNRGDDKNAVVIGEINGGTFNGEVYGGCCEHETYEYKSSTITINGGTFNANVYAGGKGTNRYEYANLIINGGTFEGQIFAGSVTANNSNGESNVTLRVGGENAPVFGAIPTSRTNKESISLVLNEDVSLAITDGNRYLIRDLVSENGAKLNVSFSDLTKDGYNYFVIPTDAKDIVNLSGAENLTAVDCETDGHTYYMITDADGTSPLYGLKAVFVGDSISYGYGDTQKRAWAERISDSTGLVSIKNAISSISVSDVRKESKGSVINDQLPEGGDYDFIMLHGMVNDAYSLSMSKIGTVKESMDDTNFDTGTFAGAVERMIYTAKTRFPEAKIAYIINFQLPCSDAGSVADMSQHAAIIIEACEKWGISYLDLYNHEELTATLDYANSKTYRADSLHPNDAGYEIITPYIQAFMEELAK